MSSLKLLSENESTEQCEKYLGINFDDITSAMNDFDIETT